MTTTAEQPTVERVWKQWDVYEAKVKEQQLRRKEDGTPQLVLKVKVLHRLKNQNDPADGVEELHENQDSDKKVFMNFATDKLEKNLTLLREAFGFDDANICKLDPVYPRFVDLTNKPCYVQVRLDEKGQDWWGLKHVPKPKTEAERRKELDEVWERQQEMLKAAYARAKGLDQDSDEPETSGKVVF